MYPLMKAGKVKKNKARYPSFIVPKVFTRFFLFEKKRVHIRTLKDDEQ